MRSLSKELVPKGQDIEAYPIPERGLEQIDQEVDLGGEGGGDEEGYKLTPAMKKVLLESAEVEQQAGDIGTDIPLVPPTTSPVPDPLPNAASTLTAAHNATPTLVEVTSGHNSEEEEAPIAKPWRCRVGLPTPPASDLHPNASSVSTATFNSVSAYVPRSRLGLPTLSPAPGPLPNGPSMLTVALNAALSHVPDIASDNDGDEEETLIAKLWNGALHSSPVLPAAAGLMNFEIDEETTLQQMMDSVPLPPLGRSSNHKPQPPSTPSIAPTPVPGFIAGRCDRPGKIVHPMIQKMLGPAPQAVLIVPQRPQATIPLHATDLTPDYMRWPAYECKGFKCLVSDAEKWGDWQASVQMFMDFRQQANFPVCA